MSKTILNYHLKLLELINSVNHASDFVDQTISTYTPSIILCLTVLFSLRSMFFIQIECWCPHFWIRNWEEYAEHVCWISDNYLNSSLRLTGQISPNDAQKLMSTKPTNYCSLVPFVLVTLAYLLKLPGLLWTNLTALQHIDLNNFLEELSRLAKDNRSTAKEYAMGILKFDWAIKKRRIIDLSIMYLLYKLFTIFILIVNLTIIQFVFGEKGQLFGVQLLKQLVYRIPWRETTMFPRIVQCLILRNEAGHPVPFVVTCVLPLNTIYEKTILAIWIWFVIMLCLSLITLLYWIYKILLPKGRQTMIKSVLERVETEENYENKLTSFFTREKCLIFELISLNIDHNFFIEILAQLLNDKENQIL